MCSNEFPSIDSNEESDGLLAGQRHVGSDVQASCDAEPAILSVKSVLSMVKNTIESKGGVTKGVTYQGTFRMSPFAAPRPLTNDQLPKDHQEIAFNLVNEVELDRELRIGESRRLLPTISSTVEHLPVSAAP